MIIFFFVVAVSGVFFDFSNRHGLIMLLNCIQHMFLEKKILSNICKKVLSACDFFVQKNNNKNINMPFFGNISPDFKPYWILNFINQDKSFKDFIYQYWKKYNNNSLVKFDKCKGSNEWIKNKQNDLTIFLRNPKIYGLDFNHSHNDFFHFVSKTRTNYVFCS